MKRILVLVVCLSIYLSIFALPASASELEDYAWFDVFDSYDFTAGLSTSGTIKYNRATLNTSIVVNSFELILYDAAFSIANYGSPSCLFTFYTGYNSSGAWEDIYWEDIGEGYYRVYGNCGDLRQVAVNSVYFAINYTSSVSSSVSIVSYKLMSNLRLGYDIECYCEILSPAINKTIHYVSTDDVNYRIWTGGDDYVNPFLTLTLTCDDWKKYDYIDYFLSVSCYNIVSVVAYFDGVQLPFTYNIVDNSYTGTKDFFVQVRLDLRGIDRSLGDDDSFPVVTISGQEIPEELNSCIMLGCTGGLVTSVVSPFVTWLGTIRSNFSTLNSYVNTIRSNIQTLLGDTSTKDEGFASDVDDKNDQLVELNESLNSVTRPALDDLDGDVSDIVSGDDLVLASQGLGSLMNNDIILSVFSMSMILCLASYVFFGKK